MERPWEQVWSRFIPCTISNRSYRHLLSPWFGFCDLTYLRSMWNKGLLLLSSLLLLLLLLLLVAVVVFVGGGSTERILFASFFSPAGFTISRGYWSRMLGHFRLWPPSWTDWHSSPRCLVGNRIDPMPDKMNIDYLKLLLVNFNSTRLWPCL